MKRKPCARTILALAVLSAIQPADAQQHVEKAERIEVTGSRIASSGLEGASPVAVVKAEEIRMSGFQSLELILNSFPQLVGEQGNRISNGASGTATVDLRGLGPFRTLVLLNGRRLPAGSPFALSADLNQIPIPLISRVDILTGGASAVYGSDAIAGVVNFILNDRFEGVQGELTYDFYNHNQKSAIADVVRARNFDLPGDKSRDGASTGANLTLGGNFANDKGNATVFLRYLKAEPLLQSERDYSACALNADARGFLCGGSPVSYPGLFFDAANGNQWTVADNLGRVRPYLQATDIYNFAPLNYYQRPGERYGFNAFANYDLSADAKVYAEFGFHDDHTVSQIAPSGIFGELVTVRYDNPLLSTDWRDRLIFLTPDGTEGTGPGTSAEVLVLRRNVEGGGRQDDLRHTSFRQVIGLKGAFARNWDYDVFMQTAKVVYQEMYRHDFSISRATRALDVVAHPVTGAAVCASALDGSDPNCVPYNIWTIGGVTPAALAYLETPGFKRGFTSQQVMGATVSADLGRYGMRLPRSRSGVEVAFGIERRTEKLELQTDVAFSTGDLAGQISATPGRAGGFTVNEIFGEARVPILDGLNISGSYRYSDYSTGKTTNTFGIGFNATPVTFARIRGSYQRAVRAADLIELFTPQAQSGYGLQGGDPCAGATPARSLADCQRTGVTAAQYGRIVDNPLGYPALFGGNPDLEPETGKTFTLGVVLTPTKGLSATVDYFDIRLEEAIDGIGPAVMLEQCLTAGTPVFCRAITRDPVFGTLWLPPAQVAGTLQNVGRMRVSGADILVAYTRELHGGNVVAIAAIGTYLSRWSFEAYPGARPTECDGLHAGGVCGRPRPTWRHRLRATWQTPWNVDLGMTWRYIHSVTNAGNPPPIDRELKAMNYLDLSASWRINKCLTLRGGINNVTDRDPPLTAGINGNTWTQTYDVLGRHIFMSLTAKF